MKKIYLRSTKNLYYIEKDINLKVYYSYSTPVAFKKNNCLTVSENVWSVTTGRHLTWIDGGTTEAKKRRIKNEDFEKLLNKELGIKETKPNQPNDHLKTVANISAIFGLMTKDKETKTKFQKRFFETVPGIHFPEDWDKLTTEEKEKRLAKVTEEARKY